MPNPSEQATRWEDTLEGLDDHQLYSAAMLAGLVYDRTVSRKEYERLRRKLIAFSRRHGFQAYGEDVILYENQTVPAWFGSTWAEPLKKKNKARRSNGTRNVASNKSCRKGRPMIYGGMVSSLEPFTLYYPGGIAHEGYERGLLPQSQKSNNSDDRIHRATQAMDQFRRKYLPQEKDGFIEVHDGRNRVVAAWYGWRWLLALPEKEYSEAKKKKLHGKVRHWARLTRDETIHPAMILDSEETLSRPVRTSIFQLMGSLIQPLRRSFLATVGMGTMRPSLKFSGALIAMLAVGGVLGSYSPDLKVGYDIWRAKGVQEAYSFFKERLVEDDNSNTQFGYAWIAYRNQKFAEATEIGKKLLEESQSPDDAARAAYLLGHIYSDTGRYEAARHYLNLALTHFRAKEMRPDIHQTLIELMYVNLWSGDLDMAGDYLDEAELFLENALEKGTFYLARAQLSFWEEEPYQALYWSRVALEGSGDYVEQRMAALSFQALSLMIIGSFDEAEEALVDARLLAVERGDLRAYHYSLIPEIVHARCAALESRSIEAQVQKWSIKNKDLALLKYLDYARTNTCNPEGGFGTPQPPSTPDDPPPDEGN